MERRGDRMQSRALALGESNRQEIAGKSNGDPRKGPGRDAE